MENELLTVKGTRPVADAAVPIAPRSDAAFTVLVVAVFLAVGLVCISQHEMWLDELQAWLIAKDSSSPVELYRNLRYEKHPGLWHLCLYVLTRFTTNPFAMQLLHLAIAAGTVFLLVKFSPFTKLHKALFPFGYFPLFEYGVISRSYALGLLLVFSFCVLFAKPAKNYWALSGVLFLLSNTSLYGLIVAAALSLGLLLQAITDRSTVESSKVRLRFACGLLVVAFGGALAFAQIVPPPEGAARAERDVVADSFDKRLVITRENKERAVYSLKVIWNSHIPVPQLSTYQFWETNILSSFSGEVERRTGVVFSLAVLILATLLFASRPPILFTYLSGTGGILLFIYLFNFGYIRHHGHLFVLLVACLWIAAYTPPSDWLGARIRNTSDVLSKHRDKYLTALLCVHLVAGIFAVSVDFLRPFSASKAAAEFIREHQLSDMLIVGRPDVTSIPLSAHLGRRIYYLENDRLGSFGVWNNERRDVELGEAFGKLSRIVEAEGRDVLLVSNVDLKNTPPSLRISGLAEFTDAINSGETYYIYLIHK